MLLLFISLPTTITNSRGLVWVNEKEEEDNIKNEEGCDEWHDNPHYSNDARWTTIESLSLLFHSIHCTKQSMYNDEERYFFESDITHISSLRARSLSKNTWLLFIIVLPLLLLIFLTLFSTRKHFLTARWAFVLCARAVQKYCWCFV